MSDGVGGVPPRRLVALAVALAAALVVLAIKLPYLGISPLHHDAASMLNNIRLVALGDREFPFGEIAGYRPINILATLGLLEITGSELTPEAVLRAAMLTSLGFTMLTAAVMALWMHVRLGVGVHVVLAAVACWVCMPGVHSFCAEGLTSTPGLLFGFTTFAAADLASVARRRAAWLAFAVGPLSLLTVLAKDPFAVLVLPCALRLLQAREQPIKLLLLAFVGGVASIAVWLGLEAAVFHPERDLTELIPVREMSLNQHPALLLDVSHWVRVAGVLALALGYVAAAMALWGVLRPSRDFPRLALALWIAAFVLIHAMFPNPALRHMGSVGLPVVLLAVGGLPARTRPSLSVAVLLGLAAVGFVFARPTSAALHTLPHAHEVRARRIAEHADPDDVHLFLTQDYAYGYWCLPDRRVVSLWAVTPPEVRQKLWAEPAGVYRDRERFAELLEVALVPALGVFAKLGLEVYVVPEPQHLEAVNQLASKGVDVSVVECIPAGSSRSQGDAFGWYTGLRGAVSADDEYLLKLSIE